MIELIHATQVETRTIYSHNSSYYSYYAWSITAVAHVSRVSDTFYKYADPAQQPLATAEARNLMIYCRYIR